jgi:hypothetical protein
MRLFRRHPQAPFRELLASAHRRQFSQKFGRRKRPERLPSLERRKPVTRTPPVTSTPKSWDPAVCVPAGGARPQDGIPPAVVESCPTPLSTVSRGPDHRGDDSTPRRDYEQSYPPRVRASSSGLDPAKDMSSSCQTKKLCALLFPCFYVCTDAKLTKVSEPFQPPQPLNCSAIANRRNGPRPSSRLPC